MKIYSSYFGNLRNIPRDYECVSIARYTPTSMHNKIYEIKSLSPSMRLLNEYHSGKIKWEEYEKRYLEELEVGVTETDLISIKVKCGIRNIVLLCFEKEDEYCHRRLALGFLKSKGFDIGGEMKEITNTQQNTK